MSIGIFAGCTDFEAINKLYRKLAFEHHPDRGGCADKMKEINATYNGLKRFYALKRERDQERERAKTESAFEREEREFKEGYAKRERERQTYERPQSIREQTRQAKDEWKAAAREAKAARLKTKKAKEKLDALQKEYSFRYGRKL